MKVFAKLARRWLKGDEGVTAIEFSLLATPFVFISIGIIELSMLFVSDSLLLGAVEDAARKIRTGEVQQTGGSSEAQLQVFKNALCETSGIMLDCSQIQYQVETISNFSAAEMTPDVDDQGKLKDQPFTPGGSEEVTLIRIMYLYPLMTPLIGTFFSDYPGNKHLLTATVVIQNEPYVFDPSGSGG